MKSVPLLVILLAMVACSKKGNDKAAPPAGSPGSAAPTPAGAPAAGTDAPCLVGSWTSKVGDKNVYTFNADKSGERIYQDTDHSTFTWSMKDPKTAIVVFPEHGDTKRAEFNFDVDCTAPEIKFQGSIPFQKS